jgi:glycerol-3-phosphate O-acyltransferase / dihydroxyacetone phosphate acyltransferase
VLRKALVSWCRLLLRIFFRKIEVVGAHHVPTRGSLLFALNHPSALIDPLFVLCLSDKKISFLAKEPLFRMPFVSLFVKAFECLPVYRSRDGGDPQKNRKMMADAAQLLSRGNALALFPEGTSHSDAALKDFRSGAARIALSARALSSEHVYLVPAAIYYEEKTTFRSRAVFAYGPPLEVGQVQLDEAGEPPVTLANELTSALKRAVEAIVPTAQTASDLVLAEKAERILSAAIRDTPEKCPQTKMFLSASESEGKRLTLAERMARRRHLIDAYAVLLARFPEAVRALIDAIRALSRQLEAVGLPIDAAARTPIDFHKKRLSLILLLILLTPLALAGALLHAPAYFLVKFFAFRFSREVTDITATVKVLSGLLFFPLTWIALGAAVTAGLSSPFGFLGALLGPPLGWAALNAIEIWGALARFQRIKREARRVHLDWDFILSERARVAEEMARLLIAAG